MPLSHFRPRHFAARHFISVSGGSAVAHDVFAQEQPPRRVRAAKSRKQQERELAVALKAVEERLERERLEALISDQISREELARQFAEAEREKAQLMAALLGKGARQDDEEAIAMLLLS